MAATKSKIMRVSVTNGDAINENRLKGKSNTGTYFICSTNQYDEFKEFFEDFDTCYVESNKVQEYLVLFKEYFFEKKNLYIDKMENFENYCSSLISTNFEPTIKISMRVNDSRYFLRFQNNEDVYVNAIRHVLYGEISFLTFEIKNNKCYIYPEVNMSKVEMKKGEDDIVYID